MRVIYGICRIKDEITTFEADEHYSCVVYKCNACRDVISGDGHKVIGQEIILDCLRKSVCKCCGHIR